jgi:hypothetical protein
VSVVPRVSQRPARPRSPHVRLVTRLVGAQAVTAAVVGLPFSRRHLPSVMLTLTLTALLCLLALAVKSGTRPAWLAAFACESVFFLYGLSRFVFARYVGGTLFALVVAVTLLHPAVARAYAVTPGRVRGGGPAEGLGSRAAR